MAFTPVTVTATFTPDGGVVPTGTIDFVLTAAMANGGLIDTADRQTLTLVGGTGSIVLNANDDVGTNPGGTGYRVTEYVAGVKPRTYVVVLSHLAPVVPLASLSPAVLGAPVVGVLTNASIGAVVPGFNASGQVLDRSGVAVVGGGAAGVVYPFATPAATWTVTHNLGRYPYGVLVIVGTSEVLADVDFPSLTQAVITHAAPTSGSVTLL